MTDLVIWGGPVFADTLKPVQWLRPTKVWAHPLEGQSNAAFWEQLKATGKPLETILSMAKMTEYPGAIGLAGFSAAHEFMSDLVGAVGDRIAALHLADSCFQGAGAATGKVGYVSYAKLAAAGKVRMTVTSNGEDQNADIHYKGPAGSKYENTTFDLTSGTKCVRNVVRDAFGGDLPETSFNLPADLPYRPIRMYKKGEFRWLVYPNSTTADPHGVHIKLAVPLIQAYMAPWLAGQGRTSPWLGKALTMLAGTAAGAYAARYVMRRAGR